MPDFASGNCWHYLLLLHYLNGMCIFPKDNFSVNAITTLLSEINLNWIFEDRNRDCE